MNKITIGLLFLLSGAISIQASDSETPAVIAETPGTEQVSKVEEQHDDQDGSEQILTDRKDTDDPQGSINAAAEKLKNRKLGAAFRQFRPSEEISADNAVPFPVDI